MPRFTKNAPALTLVLILAVLSGVFLWQITPTPENVKAPAAENNTLAGINIGGPFELVDHTGKTVSDKDFTGSYLLVYFGYSFCPDICPTSLYTMVSVLEQTPETVQKKVVPVFITVDPERDTVDVMKDYVSLFAENMVGLTGSKEQIEAVKKAYRVYGAKSGDTTGDAYLMDHSSYYYLIDTNGKTVDMMGHDTTAEEIAQNLVKYVRIDSGKEIQG